MVQCKAGKAATNVEKWDKIAWVWHSASAAVILLIQYQDPKIWIYSCQAAMSFCCVVSRKTKQIYWVTAPCLLGGLLFLVFK